MERIRKKKRREWRGECLSGQLSSPASLLPARLTSISGLRAHRRQLHYTNSALHWARQSTCLPHQWVNCIALSRGVPKGAESSPDTALLLSTPVLTTSVTPCLRALEAAAIVLRRSCRSAHGGLTAHCNQGHAGDWRP